MKYLQRKLRPLLRRLATRIAPCRLCAILGMVEPPVDHGHCDTCGTQVPVDSFYCRPCRLAMDPTPPKDSNPLRLCKGEDYARRS